MLVPPDPLDRTERPLICSMHCPFSCILHISINCILLDDDDDDDSDNDDVNDKTLDLAQAMIPLTTCPDKWTVQFYMNLHKKNHS